MRWLSTRLRPLPYQRPARQKPHYSLRKRLRYLLSRLFGTRLLKSQSLYFVTINGQRFKRLILRDSYLAAQIERNLEYFGASEHFPPLVTRYENEVWVEFVEGTPIEEVDEGLVGKIAEFYAAVYSGRSRPVNIVESAFAYRLHQNLCFLNQVGVLTDEAYGELEMAAARLRPRQVWVGFDYTDPQLQNFVITRDSGRVCAVDVESLRDEQLMGVGVARACEKWLEPFLEIFFAHLARAGVPDFRAYFPFVELSFLAAIMKMQFLEKKWKNVDPALFDRFRHL